MSHLWASLDDLEKTLPNGLHDARLRVITIDYLSRMAKIELDVDISGADDRDPTLRKGCLALAGLAFLAVLPPGSSAAYTSSEGLQIDSGPLADLQNLSLEFPQPLPPNTSGSYLFVSEWNSFIYFAADRFGFEWL